MATPFQSGESEAEMFSEITHQAQAGARLRALLILCLVEKALRALHGATELHPSSGEGINLDLPGSPALKSYYPAVLR